MKMFKYSNGKESLYPERVPKGLEYVIRPDFTSYWCKVSL